VPVSSHSRDLKRHMSWSFKCSTINQRISDFILGVCLRNKSWKPECVLSFNMDWWILVFYPEPEARDKFY